MLDWKKEEPKLSKVILPAKMVKCCPFCKREILFPVRETKDDAQFWKENYERLQSEFRYIVRKNLNVDIQAFNRIISLKQEWFNKRNNIVHKNKVFAHARLRHMRGEDCVTVGTIVKTYFIKLSMSS